MTSSLRLWTSITRNEYTFNPWDKKVVQFQVIFLTVYNNILFEGIEILSILKILYFEFSSIAENSKEI